MQDDYTGLTGKNVDDSCMVYDAVFIGNLLQCFKGACCLHLQDSRSTVIC